MKRKAILIALTAFAILAFYSDGLSQFLIEGIRAIDEIEQGRFRVLKIARVADDESVDTWQLDVLLTLGGVNSAGGPITYASTGRLPCRFSDDNDIISRKGVQIYIVSLICKNISQLYFRSNNKRSPFLLSSN